jgi:hypothetical protein
VDARAEELRRRFGVVAWPRHDVGEERLFFRGYRVGERDIPTWQVVSRRRVRLPGGLWLDRASWTLAGDPLQRLLLVDTYEAESRAAAQDVLVELLGEFQVPAALLRTDDAIGGTAFTESRGGFALYVLGNVAVRIGSGSPAPAPAPAVADHVRARMAARPPLGRAADVSAAGAVPMRAVRATTRAIAGHPVPLEAEPVAGRAAVRDATAGDGTYLKAFSTNGEVRAGPDGGLEVVPDAEGETAVEIFDVHTDGTAGAVRVVMDVDPPS